MGARNVVICTICLHLITISQFACVVKCFILMWKSHDIASAVSNTLRSSSQIMPFVCTALAPVEAEKRSNAITQLAAHLIADLGHISQSF